jgi:hypothetical protein
MDDDGFIGTFILPTHRFINSFQHVMKINYCRELIGALPSLKRFELAYSGEAKQKASSIPSGDTIRRYDIAHKG